VKVDIVLKIIVDLLHEQQYGINAFTNRIPVHPAFRTLHGNMSGYFIVTIGQRNLQKIKM
jgi:hypothetical protein